MNSGIVEFNALTDTDRTCTENDDLFLIGNDRGVFAGVGGIEVRNISVGVAGIYHAVDRENIVFLTERVDIELGLAPKLCNDLIAEAELLCFLKNLKITCVLSKLCFGLNDVIERLEEVFGYLGDIVNFIDRHTAAEKLADTENGVVLEHVNVFEYLVGGHIGELGNLIMVSAGFERADSFKEAFLKIGADAHNFARRLHLGAQGVGSGREFIERESRKLCNDVVESRLERSVGVRDLDILESHTDSDLCGYACDGIAARLGSECTRAGNAGVNLDEVVLAGMGIERELNVTAAFDLKLTDDFDCGIVEHLKVMVVKRHDRRNYDRVACMNADGVNVFHAAYGDRVVVGVTHNLEFNLLIALNALFDKNLMNRRKLERVKTDFDQFLFVIGKAAAGTAESECGTENNGIADSLCGFLCFFDIIGNFGRNGGLADRLAKLLEELSVLCALDRFAAGTQKLNAAFAKNALLFKLHCEVKTGLTADTGNDCIGALVTENLCNIFKSQGFHINLIGDGGIGHNGSGVGVTENYLISLFLKSETRLSARIVEFGSLTDNDRARADDKNLFDVCTFCHFLPPEYFYIRFSLLMYTAFPLQTVRTHLPKSRSPSKGVALPSDRNSFGSTLNS